MVEGCCSLAGPCYDHTLGYCYDDDSSNPEYCLDAINCASCFQNSRCGGLRHESAMFVESEECPRGFAGCIVAAPCYDHAIGLCNEDGLFRLIVPKHPRRAIHVSLKVDAVAMESLAYDGIAHFQPQTEPN